MPGSDALSITPTDTGLAVEGEIDAHTAPLLAAALAGRSGTVRVEMSGVGFVDSSGLRAIIEAHQACERDGERLVICHPSASVTRLLEISHLSDYLHVEG